VTNFPLMKFCKVWTTVCNLFRKGHRRPDGTRDGWMELPRAYASALAG